ncbi:MAG: WYL domain-containing protein [Archangium sp.]|nr:WYL domain-containing protein [Archangium sp.]
MKKKTTKAAAGRNDQVVRILHLLRDLERLGGCDLYELATHYGTTTRTIRRDLEALEEAGIPLKKEPGEGSKVRWALDTAATSRITNLIETTHFLALRLAMNEGLALKRQSLLFASLEDLSDRIELAIGKQGRAQLQAIDNCFFSWDKFAWRNAPLDVVLPLVDAITERKKCEVTYRAPSSGNKANSFSVLPLRLFVHHGALYLHAWQPKHQTVLPLNLHRLIALKVSDEVLPMPPGYDAAQLEATAFGIFIGPKPETFELRFDAFSRPYIEERQWHPSQKLVPQEEGGVVLSFECAPSYEVTNWVASWRDHVQVLKPEKLRAELLTYGAWLLTEYAGSLPL